MTAQESGRTILALGRSRLVVAGLLILGIGIVDLVAGRTNIARYEELLRATVVQPPADPAALFPTASEAQERYDLARAKVAFYHLLVTTGQVLSAFGFALLALGLLRFRLRALRPAPEAMPSDLPPRIDFPSPGV